MLKLILSPITGRPLTLARRLAGGFLSYELLRCTNPQFSAAHQEVLVPFIAMLYLSDSTITVTWMFVNGLGHHRRMPLQFPDLCIAKRGIDWGVGAENSQADTA